MLSRELVIWMLTGATTLMWGIWARMSATLMEAPAGLMPMQLVRSLKPLSLPIRMAVMERIMITSMAMARQLMSERRGRWTRLPMTNLFIELPVYGKRGSHDSSSWEDEIGEGQKLSTGEAVRGWHFPMDRSNERGSVCSGWDCSSE